VTLVKAGQSDPVAESWCHYVVEGRLPQFMKDAGPYIERGEAPKTELKIGTHLSTPILLANGSVYGTLCCFSALVNERIDANALGRLQVMARLLAQNLDAAGTDELQLQPMEARRTGRP
jgi:hypothetical protein